MLNKQCIKKISLCRKIIYNYIALHIIYKKNKANKIFNEYLKDRNNLNNKLDCINLQNKNNKNFIQFIYKCKKTNKIYNLFSVQNIHLKKMNYYFI